MRRHAYAVAVAAAVLAGTTSAGAAAPALVSVGDVRYDAAAGGLVVRIDVNPGIGASSTHRGDEVWVDLSFPVMTAPDGRRYKPLSAFVLVDLSRIDISGAAPRPQVPLSHLLPWDGRDASGRFVPGPVNASYRASLVSLIGRPHQLGPASVGEVVVELRD